MKSALDYFEQEVQKLGAWVDDLKLGLEQKSREIDRQIREMRRTAATCSIGRVKSRRSATH